MLESGKREREIWRRLNILITSIDYRWGRNLIACIALHTCSTGMMVGPCTFAAKDVVTPCTNHVQCFQLHKSCKASFTTTHTYHTSIATWPYQLILCVILVEKNIVILQITRIIFRCDECNFQLDMDCALMSLVKLNEEEEEVHTHPNHQHPLLLLENMPGRLIFIASYVETTSWIEIYPMVASHVSSLSINHVLRGSCH